jgi:phosphoglycolate phosphatase
MNMEIIADTIIFDFDGVLVDTSVDIANAANYVLHELGLNELPVNTIAGYIGGGAEVLMRRCLGDQADQLIGQALPMLSKRYGEFCFVETCAYPGVPGVIAHYHSAGKTMAIATQKAEAPTRRILEGLGVLGYFPIIIGPGMIKNRKPHPESVLKILEMTGAAPEKAVIVGDMASDIQCGIAAGVYTLAVTYGLGSKADLLEAKPDWIIDSIDEMLKFVK